MVEQTPQWDWQNPQPKPAFDVGGVLGRAFKGLFAQPRTLLYAMGVVIASSVLIAFITSSQMSTLGQSQTPEEMISSPSYWGVTSVTSILSMLIVLWFQIVIVLTSHASFTGRPAFAGSPLIAAMKFIPGMLLIAFIYSFVSILGFYALFIGFLFVWPGWALAGPVYIFDRAGIFGSLGAAWRLVKGYKRWLLLVLVVLSIVGMVIYSVILGISLAISGVNMFDTEATMALNQNFGSLAIVSVISSIGLYFLYGIFAAGMTAAYVELKRIREGGTSLADVFE